MQKQVLFKIEAIQENDFSIDLSISSQPEDIDFDIEGGVTTKLPDRLVDVFFTVTFLLIQSNKTALSYTTTVTFYIDNLHEFITNSDGEVVIDEFLRKKLIDISLHTVRGMLAVKTAGTGLASCYLPLID